MTLLELSIAVAIMASSLVFILGSVVSLSMTSDVAADQAATMAYLSTMVEELRIASENDLLLYVPPEPPAGSPELTVQLSYVLDEDTTFTPPMDVLAAQIPELPNPLHVTVSVSGVTKSGRPYTMQTATMVRR